MNTDHQLLLTKELNNYLKSETAFTATVENMKKLTLWLEKKEK